jgi:hypothetical protein
MFEAVQRTIETEITSFWTDTPIKLENVPFNTGAAEFIAVTIRDGGGDLVALSPKREDHVGVIMVQIFTKKNIGTGKARAWADKIARHFRTTSRLALDHEGNQATLLIRTPYPVVVGERANHFQINLNIPYETQEAFV